MTNVQRLSTHLKSGQKKNKGVSKIKSLISPRAAINDQIEILKNHNLYENRLRTRFFCDIAKNCTP